MKNLNVQYIAASAGAALLASFATLATPNTARAASLSMNATGVWESSKDGEAVEKIYGIDVGGTKYNVTFETLKIEDIRTKGVQYYLSGVNAEEGAVAIEKALGTNYHTITYEDMECYYDPWVGMSCYETETIYSDRFHSLVRVFDASYSWNTVEVYGDRERDELAEDRIESYRWGAPDGEIDVVAVFRAAEAPVSTPEPSLTLGSIALGGLMLGSKRKTKA